MIDDVDQRTGRASVAAVRHLVELACLAPSVHNTQPWRWRYDAGELVLHADEYRRLPMEDPDGRNLAISCGSALHHLQFAARALGWETAVRRMPVTADESVLARVTIGRPSAPVVTAGDVGVLRRRCTDRRRFTAWPLPVDRLQRLCREAERWGARAQVIDSIGARFRLEVLANRAVTYTEVDERRSREQDAWIERPGPDGIPLAALPADTNPLRARTRFRPGVLEDTRLALGSGDGVLALGAPTDDVGAWLRTGEALSALWLDATRDGLSVVPLSQPIEIDQTRHDIETTVLGGAFRPHVLVRVGWQPIGRSDLPRTPRRPVDDVFDAVADRR